MRSSIVSGLILSASIALGIPHIVFAQTGDVASLISTQYYSSTVFLAVHGITNSGQQEDKTGTGFVISSEGYVLTVSHLVADANRIPYAKTTLRGSLGMNFDVAAPTGVIFPLEFIRTNADIDVALLKLPSIPTQSYVAVHFCRGLNSKQGSRIHSLGFPLGMPLSVNSGTLSNKDGPRGLWKTDILVNEGSSGGPVFDNSGHVIGMIKGGITGAAGNNFIVPANLMLDILQTGLSSIDDCAESAQALPPSDCESKIVSFPIELTKSDHPTFNPDSRVYTKVFPAQPNYTIESAQFVSASQNKAGPPQIIVSPDKSSLRFETNIQSGPFFDQWRGWLVGELITTQKPKCAN
jgi:S1-C subfamily serine protease